MVEKSNLDVEDDIKSTPASGSDSHSVFQAYVRVFRYGTSSDYVLQAIALLAALASGVGLAMVNLIFGNFVTLLEDFTSASVNFDEVMAKVSQNALYFVYIAIGRFVLTYVYSSLATIVAYRIVQRVRSNFVQSALRQELAYYDKGSSASISMQATTNGNLIHTGIAEKLGTVFQAFSAFVSAFTLAFVVQWKLTLITASVVPVMIIAILFISALEAVVETNVLKILGQAGSFAEGILSSIRTIHAFDLRSRLVRKYELYLSEALKEGKKKNLLYGFLFSTEYFLIYVAFALAFWRGANMLESGEIRASGDIFTVLLSVIIGATAITNIAPQFIFFTRAASAAAELFTVIDRASQIDPLSAAGSTPNKVEGVLEFNNINFEYPARPGVPVLEDFSLRVPAGKVTALVGASGSGKSTIVGLTERWYNPQSGQIKLDGHELDTFNLRWLRTTVRLVQQEPVLFSGTVYDNIINGLVGTPYEHESDDSKMQRVIEAAKIAFAHDFIEQLPESYRTNIGQRGGLLSGGQKQRIAIARSIISNPKVLLLDEATSALDPHAESIVQQALNNASRNRTTITIAHKMSTIRDADNIVVMSKGRIVEQGTHDDLMRLNQNYARLVNVQDLAVSQQPASTPSSASDGGNEPNKEAADLAITRTQSVMTTSPSARQGYDYTTVKASGMIHIVRAVVRDTAHLKHWYILLSVTCLLAGGTFPAQALLAAELIKTFQLTGSELVSRGGFLALMFFVVGIVCFLLYFVMGWASNSISQNLNFTYRRQLLDRMLRQDLEFFDRDENSTGALVSRLGSHPQSILELMGANIALICIGMVNIFACSILALVYAWKLGLVIVLAGLPPLLFCGWLKIRLEARIETMTGRQFSNSAKIASEAVTAMRTVSSMTMETSVLAKYNSELGFAMQKLTKAILLMMPLFALTQSIEYMFLALGFWYGSRLVLLGEISLYGFFVSFIGVYFAGQAAAQLFTFSSSITKGKHAANYVLWLQQLEPSITDTDDNRDVGPPKGLQEIDFNKVRFSYPLRPDTTVMRDTSLNVTKGQFIALVGASGCGKSTMIALLERFYDPARGSIQVDNMPLTKISPWRYRQSLSLVQQEPTLYQGTVRENIAFGSVDENLPDVKIEAACRAANAWDFVSSLPDGLHTQCGLHGSQFSGGQRQRIAIARALVRDPKVLLLDEATSALDTESEKIVQQALSRAAKESDRITIAVAHRLSTVRDADAIHVFSGGRIVESGTHAELMAHGKLYPAMCQSQNVA